MTVTAGPPAAVCDVNAHFYGGDHSIGQRLLTDPNMGQVWQTLMGEGRERELDNPQDFEGRLDSLPDLYRMEKWTPTYGVSLAERACASFFLATSIIFAVGNRAVTEGKITKEMKRWQDGAALCREALLSPHRACVDLALAQALETSAAYFEEWGKIIKNANMNSPYLVERAGQRDDIRAQVRHVATVTREIFGSFMYGTVATAASIAAGLPISLDEVDNWCHDDLTLPSH